MSHGSSAREVRKLRGQPRGRNRAGKLSGATSVNFEISRTKNVNFEISGTKSVNYETSRVGQHLYPFIFALVSLSKLHLPAAAA